MASRPVFIPKKSATAFVREVPVEFQWFAGMAASQKQKSIDSLHAATRKRLGVTNVLEISSKSRDRLGVQLSAFNLSLPIQDRNVTVEVAFQSSKRFENGGPYLDLLAAPSRDAKRDPRLQESGRLVSFTLDGDDWPLEPRTVFYDWLYLQALKSNPELAQQLLPYEAFTDIEFNPEKSLNCQARSAALYVSLHKEGLLADALRDRSSYLSLFVNPSSEGLQRGLF